MKTGRRAARLAPLLGVLLLLSIVAPNFFVPWVNNVLLFLPGVDKVFHFLVFGTVFLLLYSLAGETSLDERRRTWIAAAVAVGLTVADESIQGLVRGRSVELADLAAGIAGIATGIVLTGIRGRSRLRTVLLLILPTLVVAAVVTDTFFRERDVKRGLRLENRGDFIGARESYLRALERGNRRPGLYNSLAWVELESGIGDPERALQWAGIAIAADPDHPDFLDTYGWALVRAGHPESALEYLERARELKPSIWCIHFHLAIACLESGKTEEAIVQFRKQIERAPESREGVRAQEYLENLEPSEPALLEGTENIHGSE